jgi:hypothetical protein
MLLPNGEAVIWIFSAARAILLVCANKMKLRIFFEIKMSIPLPRILVRLTVSVSLSLMKPRAKIGDYVMVLQKITEKGGNIG